MKTYTIPCALIRGGTTKGVYINTCHLPKDKVLRDKLILALFGSPDHRQINGLGGADPLTSKVALVSIATEPGVDLYYESGEVGIDEPSINYSTMCGNLASGVGLFAIAEGLISSVSPYTHLTLRNLNTGKLIRVQIPVDSQGTLVYQGNCDQIDGVPSPGVEVKLSFDDPNGPITGKLLPTDAAQNVLQVEGRNYSCSLVDCGTLYAIFQAETFGLTGLESAEALDANIEFKLLIEKLRAATAELLSQSLAKSYSTKQIKIAISGKPLLKGDDYLINARVINRYKTHKAFPVTGAICFSAACIIPGTLLNISPCVDDREHSVAIGHPEGVLTTQSQCGLERGQVKIDHTCVKRSSRILLRGVSEVQLIEA